MFWKFIEIIVRIIYWKRFHTAKKIGEAAALLSDGKPEMALSHLQKYGNSVHQTLIPLFALTQGKILEAMGRMTDAEASYRTAVLTNPRDARADVALAVLTGRQFRFEDCRSWLNRALEKEDSESTKRAQEILLHLDAIENGEIQRQFENRAMGLAEKVILGGRAPGFPPDTKLLAAWVGTPEAKDHIDDVALLLAYAETQQNGHWKIGLSIEDTVVIKSDGEEYRPFETIASWLRSTGPATQPSLKQQ